MSAKINREGFKSGLLTIGKELFKEGNKTFYLAKCICGEELIVSNLQINKGIQSCGCLKNINCKEELTRELIVCIEKRTAITLLLRDGLTKEEAEEEYDKFQEEYFKSKDWL